MANGKPAHGTFCWNELMTRDVEKAKEFYCSLLGWTAQTSDLSDDPYFEFKAGDKSVGGMMAMPAEIPPQVPSHWMGYITVDEIDPLVDRVKQLGGKVEHGPQDIEKVGRFCIITDPTGSTVGLIQLAG